MIQKTISRANANKLMEKILKENDYVIKESHSDQQFSPFAIVDIGEHTGVGTFKVEKIVKAFKSMDFSFESLSDSDKTIERDMEWYDMVQDIARACRLSMDLVETVLLAMAEWKNYKVN